MIAILFLGNSYTERNNLAGVTAELLAAAGEVAETQSLTADGFTWEQHLAKVEAGAPGWAEAFALPWSRVVLQEQSQIPGFPEDNPEVVASRAAAVSLDALVRSAGADTWLFLTWGRRDGDADNREIYPDFPTMSALLDAGTLATRAELPAPAYVAPAGRAFSEVYDDVVAGGGDPLAADSNFYRLYSNDGSHPSTLGTYLVACVFTTSFTGVPCSGLPALTVPEEDAAWLQAAADAAVFGADDLLFPWTLETGDDTGGPSEAPESGAADPVPVASSGGCANVGFAPQGWVLVLGLAGWRRRAAPARR